MPITPQSIYIDPQGVEYVVDLTDLAGSPVTAYTARDGASSYSLPVTITEPTTFWFALGSAGHERNATAIVVSAKFLGVECAGAHGTTAVVPAQNWQSGRLVLELGDDALELANLLDASGGGGGGGDGAVWRAGSGVPSNALGADGDFYLDEDTGDVYERVSGSYVLRANIKGPQGDPGADGADGEDGAPGTPGADGSDGAPGADGSDGAPGADGADGADGAPGSVWRNGAGVPSNSLGIDGDYYLNDTNEDYYKRVSGAYVLQGNIKGATGAAGSNGTNGTNGTNGSAGATGAVGVPAGCAATFTWDSGTSNANPGSGKIRANNATESSASTLYANNADVNGVDISTIFQTGLSNSARFILRHETDPTKWIAGSGFYNGSAGAFFSVGVTAFAQSASSPFVAGDRVTLTMVANGDAGTNGTDGAAGPNVGYGLFGDGSDGVVNFDGSTVVLGLTPSSNVYSLTRDLYLADGSQLSGSAVISCRNFRIFCSGTLTVGASAVIRADGGNAATSTGGTASGATPSAHYAAGGAGGAGHTSGAGAGAGTAGNAVAGGSVGGNGGAGGIASGSGTGGGSAGGAATAAIASDGVIPRNLIAAMHGYFGGSGVYLRGGAGGAGGSNATSSTGGGGGGGGGICAVFALKLVNSGAITAKGGIGAAGSGAGTGAGGGGGGGGGAAIVACGPGSTVGTLTVTGGAGGARQGVGANGVAGSNGNTFTLNL